MRNPPIGGDDEDQLIEVAPVNPAPNSLRLTFVYDGFGRRRVITTYIYDGSQYSVLKVEKLVYKGWNLVAVLDGDDQLVKSFLWGADISGTEQGAGGVGGLLAETNATGTYYPAYDSAGNIMSYVDSSGVKVAEYFYDPFGRTRYKSGPKADDFVFRFSTKYHDETGYIYYGRRFYHPEIMKWLSRDPLGEDGGENLYHFCLNNTLLYYDYLGREFVPTGDKKYKEEVNKALGKIEENLKEAEKKAKTKEEKAEAKKALEYFEKCKKSKSKIKIKKPETGDGNAYDPNTDTIEWDPDKKTGGKNEKGSTERPPYVGLGHETSHGYDEAIVPDKDRKSKSSDPKKYPNKTEEKAVKFENQIRKGAGEPLRPKY